MDYRIDWSAQADIDADEIAARIARAMPRAAERWLEGVFEAVNSLDQFPERCSLAPEAESVSKEIRQLFYGKRRHRYRILFTIDQGVVYILRIVHGAHQRLRRDQLGEGERHGL